MPVKSGKKKKTIGYIKPNIIWLINVFTSKTNNFTRFNIVRFPEKKEIIMFSQVRTGLMKKQTLQWNS